MLGTESRRDFAFDFQAQVSILRPSIHARSVNIIVKFQDLYGFTVEGNVDDVNILNEVREKVRQQGKVWWALEASKGSNWYLQTHVSSTFKSSLNFSNLVNAIALKRLIRKGIPLVLRPKVWFSLSGAAKKKLTVPNSYYNDLIVAVEGKVRPATTQIDHGKHILIHGVMQSMGALPSRRAMQGCFIHLCRLSCQKIHGTDQLM